MALKSFEFDTTSIPSQFAINLRDQAKIQWIETRTADFYRAIFNTITGLLKIYQNKKLRRIGAIIKDDNGNFKLGGILNYVKPDENSDEEDNGNMYLEFTVNPDEMNNEKLSPENQIDEIYDNNSSNYTKTLEQELFSCASARVHDYKGVRIMVIIAIDTLLKFLDVNATEGDEVEVNLKGVFKATVVVNNGVKVISIVPGEYVKQIIKNDAIL